MERKNRSKIAIQTMCNVIIAMKLLLRLLQRKNSFKIVTQTIMSWWRWLQKGFSDLSVIAKIDPKMLVRSLVDDQI